MGEANSSSVVYYVGLDNAFLGNLKRFISTLDSNPSLKILQIEPLSSENKSVESLFLKIWKEMPFGVIFDIGNSNANSKESKDQQEFIFKLAKYIRFDGKTKKIPAIGLHDYLSPKWNARRGLINGIRFHFIKSGEYEQIINCLYHLGGNKPQKLTEPYFAKVEKDSTLLQDLRIGYATPSMYRIETNTQLDEGIIFELREHPLSAILGRINVVVKKSKEGAIYYNYRYAYSLDFKSSLPDHIFEDKDYKWFWAKMNSVIPKSTRVMIYDPNLSIFKDQKITNFDELPFSLKLQTSLVDFEEYCNRFLPMIIILIKPSLEDLEKIYPLVSAKKIEKTQAMVVFGAPELENEFGKKSNIIYSEDDLNFDLIKKLQDIYEKKHTNENKTPRLYFRNDQEESVTTIARPIKILGYSELHMLFKADFPIPDQTVFTATFPQRCFVTVFAQKEKGVYKGIFHYLNEFELKELRQGVNKIAFKDLDEKKRQEKEQWEKLNQDKLKELEEKKGQNLNEASKISDSKTNKKS